jgi:hypothetical protein
MKIDETKKQEILELNNKCILGEHVVDVKKLTPSQYKKVIAVVDCLPDVVFQTFTKYLFSENKGELFVELLVSAEMVMDEIVSVTSVLTGLEENHINEEIPLVDITRYFVKLIELNNLDKAIKNMLSPLLKVMKTENL